MEILEKIPSRPRLYGLITNFALLGQQVLRTPEQLGVVLRSRHGPLGQLPLQLASDRGMVHGSQL